MDLIPENEKQPTLARESKANEKTGRSARIFRQLQDIFSIFDRLEDEGEKLSDSSGPQFLLKAESHAEKVAVPSHEQVHAHLLRNALLLIDNGDFKLARHVLGEMLRHNPTDIDAIRWMGWCFRADDDLATSLKCYQQLVHLRGSDDDYFELGEIQYDLKQFAEARDSWMKALLTCKDENGRLFDLYRQIGNASVHTGDLDDAEENYNKALTLRPFSDVIHVNTGSVCLLRNEVKRALECFKHALELNAFNDKAWVGVSAVAQSFGDLPWSDDCLLRALQLNPYNLTALQILVGRAQATSEFQKAIPFVQAYVEAHEADSHMRYVLAGLYFQAKDVIRAEREIARLKASGDERVEVLELENLIHQRGAPSGA